LDDNDEDLDEDDSSDQGGGGGAGGLGGGNGEGGPGGSDGGGDTGPVSENNNAGDADGKGVDPNDGERNDNCDNNDNNGSAGDTSEAPERRELPHSLSSTTTSADVMIPLDKENPLRCVECGEEFGNHFAVKNHYQDVHLRLSHKCTVDGCNAGFPSKRSRDRHSSNLNLHRKLLSTTFSAPSDPGSMTDPPQPPTTSGQSALVTKGRGVTTEGERAVRLQQQFYQAELIARLQQQQQQQQLEGNRSVRVDAFGFMAAAMGFASGRLESQAVVTGAGTGGFSSYPCMAKVGNFS